ncbi:hypothetical protein FRB90_004928, partial [Tulasnella sp. 427]
MPAVTPLLSLPGLPTPPLSPPTAYRPAAKVSPSAAEKHTQAFDVEHASLKLLQNTTASVRTPKTQVPGEGQTLAITTPAFTPSQGRATPPLSPITPLRVVKKFKSPGVKIASELSPKTANTHGLGLIIDTPPVGRMTTKASPTPACCPLDGRATPSPPPTQIRPLRLIPKTPRAGIATAVSRSPKAVNTASLGLHPHRHPSERAPVDESAARYKDDRMRAIQAESLALELQLKLDAERAKTAALQKRIEELESSSTSANPNPDKLATKYLRFVPKDRRCCKNFHITLSMAVRGYLTSERRSRTTLQDELGGLSAYPPPAGRASAGHLGLNHSSASVERTMQHFGTEALDYRQPSWITDSAVLEERRSTGSSTSPALGHFKTPPHILSEVLKVHASLCEEYE